MDGQEILNNINRIVESYEKNLELEDIFIKDSSCKLANELYDTFNSYGFNRPRYESLLKEVVETHLFYGYKANKNKYVNDNEESIRTIRRLVQVSIEEKLAGVDINHHINTYRDDIDKSSNTIGAKNNIERSYADMIADLQRRFMVNNDDLWYEVNRKLKSSIKEIIDGVCKYRKQNSVLLHSPEEMIKGIELQNNKYEQVFSQIDQIKDIEQKKNDERRMKYGQEIATMLNYQFTELSNEALSLISSNSIDPNEVNALKLQTLNSILPNFNRNYAQLFDKLNNVMVPMFIKNSKSLIEKGEEVDFEKDKSTKDGILRYWYNGSDAFGIDLNSFDDCTNDIVTDIIANKYSIKSSDSKYKQIYEMVTKRLESIKKYSNNFKKHILDENIQEIEQMSNDVVMGKSINDPNKTTLANQFK